MHMSSHFTRQTSPHHLRLAPDQSFGKSWAFRLAKHCCCHFFRLRPLRAWPPPKGDLRLKMARAEKNPWEKSRIAMDSDGTTRAKHTDAENPWWKTGKWSTFMVGFPNIPWLVYFCSLVVVYLPPWKIWKWKSDWIVIPNSGWGK